MPEAENVPEALTKSQVDCIVASIQGILAKAGPNLLELDALIDSEYAKGRKPHTLTALVYSAFSPERMHIDGLTIRKRNYGKGLCLPELITDSGLTIYVYNSAAKADKTKEVAIAVERLAGSFQMLEFSVSSVPYSLARLSLVSFSGCTSKGYARIDEVADLYP